MSSALEGRFFTTGLPELGSSPGEGNGHLLQYSCLKNPMDRGAWWAAAHGSQRVRHDRATKHSTVSLLDAGAGTNEALCGPPETVTALLISYTPMETIKRSEVSRCQGEGRRTKWSTEGF